MIAEAAVTMMRVQHRITLFSGSFICARSEWLFLLSWVKTIGISIGRKGSALVILGWGVTLASLAVTAIVYGIVIPRAAEKPNMPIQGVALYYAGMFVVSLLAGMILASVPRSLIGAFVSQTIAASLTYIALILPGLTGILDQTTVENLAVDFVFTAFFPLGMFLGLRGFEPRTYSSARPGGGIGGSARKLTAALSRLSYGPKGLAMVNPS